MLSFAVYLWSNILRNKTLDGKLGSYCGHVCVCKALATVQSAPFSGQGRPASSHKCLGCTDSIIASPSVAMYKFRIPCPGRHIWCLLHQGTSTSSYVVSTDLQTAEQLNLSPFFLHFVPASRLFMLQISFFTFFIKCSFKIVFTIFLFSLIF